MRTSRCSSLLRLMQYVLAAGTVTLLATPVAIAAGPRTIGTITFVGRRVSRAFRSSPSTEVRETLATLGGTVTACFNMQAGGPCE